MSSDREVFDIVGPSYLTHIDWENPVHCRAVYVLEGDRQFSRQSLQALARPWRNSANFQLNQILTDAVDFSTFGAIFENKSNDHSSKSAPLYVIAFRGTMNEPSSRIRETSAWTFNASSTGLTGLPLLYTHKENEESREEDCESPALQLVDMHDSPV